MRRIVLLRPLLLRSMRITCDSCFVPPSLCRLPRRKNPARSMARYRTPIPSRRSMRALAFVAVLPKAVLARLLLRRSLKLISLRPTKRTKTTLTQMLVETILAHAVLARNTRSATAQITELMGDSASFPLLRRYAAFDAPALMVGAL